MNSLSRFFNSGLRMMLLGIAGLILTVVIAVIAFSLQGCGGGFTGTNQAATSQRSSIQGRWINRTSMPDSVAGPFFERKLIEAKAELYKPQVNLNGDLVRDFTFSEMSCMQAIEPRDWEIVGLRSVPAAELNALPTCQNCPYVDPSPFVYCPDNPKYKYCNAYLHDGAVNIPDAYPEFIGPYEMDNKIMDVCHVDIGAR